MNILIDTTTIQNVNDEEDPSDSGIRRRMNSIDTPPRMSEIRVVVLGKSLSENCSVGNIILGTEAFITEDPLHSREQHSLRVSRHVKKRYLTIINTPSLFDPGLSQEELSKRIKECVSLSDPGPHAFLLMVRPHDFTETDLHRLRCILNSFSDQAKNYCILIRPDSKSPKHQHVSYQRVKEFSEKFFLKQSLENENKSIDQLIKEIDKIVKKNGGVHVTCEVFEDVQEEPCISARERGKETKHLPEERKHKMGLLKHVQQRGISTIQSKGRSVNQQFTEMPESSSLKKLNLVLCGTDGALKDFISDFILGQREERVESSSVCVIRKGEVTGHQITLVEMPTLDKTQLSEQEVMHQSLQCVSTCDPGVHAFLIIVPVGPLTDEDKAELETFQMVFSSRVYDHTVVIFTNQFDTDAAAAKFVEQSSETKQLCSMCGGRYIIIKDLEHNCPPKLIELLDQVTEMVNVNEIYSLLMYVEAQKDGVKQELEKRMAEMEKTIQHLRTKQLQICAAGEAVDPSCLRIVLIGKTGNGKSASGNTILGRKEFICNASLTSVTQICQKGVAVVKGKAMAIVDTPGLFDTTLTNKETIEEIVKCISLSAPGPHVFLIVLSVGRITPEEMETLNLIKNMFGGKAANYTMVLFTRGDDLEDELTIEDYIKNSGHAGVLKLIRDCGGRVHLFNNKEKKDCTQVDDLLRKIEDMIAFDRNNYFTNEMLEMAEMSIQQKQQEILKEKEEQMKAEKEALEAKHKEELQLMKKSLEKGKELLEEERMKRENKFKDEEESLKREYEKKEDEARERQRVEDQRRAEEKIQQSLKFNHILEEMKKEIEDEKNKLIKQQNERDEEDRKRAERERQDKECFEQKQRQAMEELKFKQKEEIEKRDEEERKRRKEQEEEMEIFKKKMKEEENSKREIKDLERKLQERELECKEQMRKREKEYRRTKERHEKERQQQEEYQKQIRKRFERERKDDGLQIEKEREEWKEMEKKEREQLEKRHEESKLKLKKEYEDLEKLWKAEWERQTREENKRKDEEGKNLQKRREEMERERQEEMEKREREDRVRKAREAREREEMKEQYEEKEKKMKHEYEAEARRQAEHLNNVTTQLEKRIGEVIKQQQRDSDLLIELYQSAKSQLDKANTELSSTKAELDKSLQRSSCVIL